nr:hypothetical protein [Tanacetum cinerariifolium]
MRLSKPHKQTPLIAADPVAPFPPCCVNKWQQLAARCGVVVAARWWQRGNAGGSVVAAVGSGGRGGVEMGRRVKESGVEDRIDRETGSLFGFAEKSPPEKFSGGGVVVAGGWGELIRVLVTMHHNKTLYNLFHDRTPAISFLRPFGYPVTIFNTIDHLGSGPKWLFDIDALTKTMNYQPVVARSNDFLGVKGKDIGIFEDSHDDEDVFGAEADFHNLDSTFQCKKQTVVANSTTELSMLLFQVVVVKVNAAIDVVKVSAVKYN